MDKTCNLVLEFLVLYQMQQMNQLGIFGSLCSRGPKYLSKILLIKEAHRSYFHFIAQNIKIALEICIIGDGDETLRENTGVKILGFLVTVEKLNEHT